MRCADPMAGLRVTDVEDRKTAQGGRRQGRTRLKETYENAIGDNLSLQAMKEVAMKLLLATFLAMFLFIPETAQPQVSCFSNGGMLSCDSRSGNTLITPLSPSQGVIQSERSLEPYTIMPPSSSRDSFSASRSDSFSSPIASLGGGPRPV
jgi:hypothetical protein